MSGTANETRTVIVERDYPYPPGRVWRALSQPHLVAEWLMDNDFEAVVGRSFTLRAQPQGDWDGIVECEVLTIEPERSLSYTWNSGSGALRIASVVTFTLTPTSGGTRLRMEQTGFRPDQTQNFQGAKYGWQHFLENLAGVLESRD